jgi:hypothetical protein
MPRKKHVKQERTVDLLEKILVFQLYALGVPQERIAKTVGRQTVWVNDLVRGIPKGGKSDDNQAKSKKANRRSRSL